MPVKPEPATFRTVPAGPESGEKLEIVGCATAVLVGGAVVVGGVGVGFVAGAGAGEGVDTGFGAGAVVAAGAGFVAVGAVAVPAGVVVLVAAAAVPLLAVFASLEPPQPASSASNAQDSPHRIDLFVIIQEARVFRNCRLCMCRRVLTQTVAVRRLFDCVNHRTFPSSARVGPLLMCFLAVWWAGFAPLAMAADEPNSLALQTRAQMDATLGGLVREGRSSFAAGFFVERGGVSFARAYGVEGPGSTLPFSIDSTLIDLNSIGKLFTAIAVAQLIDRGVIGSIDDPINRYLQHFKLPPAFGREVTIRAVATHSAGFDETEFGAGPLEATPALFFERRFPGYVPNPQLFSSYDSYGPRLLAYMVSELTGESFIDYVERSIIGPLGMSHTYVAASPTPLTHRVLAFQPKSPSSVAAISPLKPRAAAPLGSVFVSTMSDIALLVNALLGSNANQDIITQPMRDLMFQILQANGDYGSGHGLLFDALRSGPTRLFVHGGVGPGIRCMLALDVRRGAGMFYCYGDARSRLDHDPTLFPPAFEQITDQMLKPFIECRPAETPDCVRYPPAAWHEDWNRYLGLYVDVARHHRGFSRLRTLIHATTVNVARAAGTLRLDDKPGFVEIAPGVFGNPRYLETLSFIDDPVTGKFVLSVSDRPSVYERPSLLDDPRVIPPLLAALVVIALSGGLFVLPIQGIAPGARLAVAAYAAIVGCGIVDMFGLSAFGQRYFAGVEWPLDILRLCAFLTVPACAALLFAAYRANTTASIGAVRWRRLHLNVIAASSLLLVLTLLIVNLIGFSRIT